MKRVGLVGFGSIGRFLVENWTTRLPDTIQLAAVCVRPRQISEAVSLVPVGTKVCVNIEDLLQTEPSIVIEAAGREAAEAYSEALLRAGKVIYLLSVGILANPEVRSSLLATAQKFGGRISIPAGALAGFDGLLALAKDGITSVHYTSTKPIHAWQDTLAEQQFALSELKSPTVIFHGNARDAAQSYPKNANLAAAVALAGIGFEKTEISLIADPHAIGNSATLRAKGTASELSVIIQGAATTTNPKTSAIVGASVLSALDNSDSLIQFV